MKSSPKKWLIFVVLGVLALTLVGIWLSPARALFTDQQALTVWLQQWGTWVPLVTIGLHIAQVLTAPIPGTAIDTVNGFLFGPWLGTIYSMVGLQLGALLMLLLVRKYGRPLAERFISSAELTKFDQRVERSGAVIIFLVFLFPFMPDDLILVLAGLTSLSLTRILLLAFVGRLPGVFIANLLGSRAATFSRYEWLGILVVILVMVVFFWQKQAKLEEKITNLIERISIWWQNYKP